MNEIYLVLSGAVGAFLLKLVEWIFNKKSQKADVKAKDIENEIKLSEYYKKMLDDLDDRYEAKFIEFVALYERKEKILKDEIFLLNRKIKDLKAENIALRKRIKEFEP